MLRRWRLAALAAVLVGFLSSETQAQATRTFVSGVGNDADPCSRTAPCRTFQGAFSKTFINGEINILDPGGYGTINITKSMTIDGTGSLGHILASGTTGIIINLTDNTGNDPLKTVRIRNINISGIGASGTVGTRTGTIGIRILSAAAVYIENVLITDFSNRGISDERSTPGKLFVTNSIVRNTGQSGIVLVPSQPVRATFDNVISEGNGLAGFALANGVKATANRSTAAGNAVMGFYAEGTGTVFALKDCVANDNGTGIMSQPPGTPEFRLTGCAVFNNTTGVQNNAGQLLSYGTNDIGANGSGNTGITPAAPARQ